ncbi:hypothetical protein [Haladaptatus sp.]|uniref:hypothetical protein n=1 Tax=Haladaptatus sp. TaxID=1973141 RepID=UPI003C3462CD
MTSDNHGGMGSRRPRIEASDPQHETEQRLYERLHAEIASLHRRLAETQRRVATLEAERERWQRVLRACSMCGRVSTRPEPDDRCPYCQTGRLHRL